MKNKKIYLVIAIVLIGLLIIGGSFAYWNWLSNENKTVVFNTSKNIQEYIVYDEGESKFVGDFKVGSSYLDGVHTTVSIHKTSEAANIILYASINMRIKEIGANLANSEGLKWVITSGDSTSGGEVLASGDFYGSKSNDEFIILDNIEVTETLTSYTVWIWLDEGYATSEMTGEKIDTAIWTQVNQYPENNFEVTNLSNNYQVINATVVNSNNNIVSYAVTDSNIEPVKNKIDKVVASPLVSRSNDSELTMLADSTNWIDIPAEDQKKVYVLKYVVNSTGTYYIWFKDSSGKVISKEITVNDISTDKPVCTWSNPGSSAIKDGESTTITLTCIDTSSKIINSDISISDITVSGTSITVSDNIVKERIENGYKYTFTVSTGGDLGISTITIPANLITNEFNLGNNEVISSSITYSAVYTVNFDGNMFSTSSNSITSNGLTITYEPETSILTINGTPTSTWIILNYQMGLTFTEGDKYNLKATYVSGNAVNAGTGGGSLSVDIKNSSMENVSTRNYADILFGNESSTLTVNSASASEGAGFAYFLWFATPSDWTINNLKLKVNMTKEESKKVTNGLVYGNMPIPSRSGFAFDGWYTGENGTGTEITSNTVASLSSDQTLYAKWIDDIKPYGTANLSLTDGVFTLTLSNYGDDGSGLTGTYGFALISSGNCENATYEYQTEISKTYNENLNNNVEYFGCIKLEDNSGNITYAKSSGIEFLYSTGTQTYTTSGEYEFTVPATGTYKLEVWGAQGATSGGSGGYGGYSVGNVSLTKNEISYINVGGQGTVITGGYNGGGDGSNAYSTGSAYKNGGGGGGATHIATVSGELSNYSSTKDEIIDKILIVAGGGGGGAYISGNYAGGSGGGISGVSGTGRSITVASGTQTSGYAFGQGQTGLAGGSYSWGESGRGGGGGGYYGGAASQTAANGIAGGGGGSGYIGNSLLTDKYMYCYNCTTSDVVSTKTYTTTNVSDTPTSDYAKSGDGAARITWDFFNNQTTITLTYDNQGGSGCYSKSVTSGSIYGELCTPVKDGYIFNGWYTEASGGTEITSSTTVSETVDHTIYAHWTKATNPVITFSNNGTSGYVSGNVSSKINVSKGSSDLDYNSFKYVYSTDRNATPDKIFYRGYEYTLENATGIYYLIAKACDVNGNCTMEVSNPFYVDNSAPSGSLILNTGKSSINIEVNASDQGSGINTYEYLATLDSSCPTTGYVSSNNSSYTLYLSKSGNYNVCVRITDKAGNIAILSQSIEYEYTATPPYGIATLSYLNGVYSIELFELHDDGNDLNNTYGYALLSSGECSSATYIESSTIPYSFNSIQTIGVSYYGCVKLSDSDGTVTYLKTASIEATKIYYSQLSNNYSCANSSAGDAPIISYTGDCTILDDANENWRIKFLTSGTLTSTTIDLIDVFLVGGGGGGGGADKYYPNQYDYTARRGGGGGGGYTNTQVNISMNSTEYDLVVGAGGAGGTNNSSNNGCGTNGSAGTASSAFGFSANPGKGGIRGCSGFAGGNGGSGGGAGAQGDYGKGTAGGSDGASSSGTGQGTTTREFGESTGDLYSGGGGGGGCSSCGGAAGGSGGGGSGGTGSAKGVSGTANTGGGGGGSGSYDNSSYKGGDGGTGIVVIRNARSSTQDMYEKYTTSTLIYNNTGGTGCYYGSIINGKPFGELCVPSRDGYVFSGWYTAVVDGTEITASSIVSSDGDYTLYAKWSGLHDITFNPIGQNDYIKDSFTTNVVVVPDAIDIDYSTLKYVFSQNRDAEPTISFNSGDDLVLSDVTGIYYLIATACDINGNCVRKISDAIYMDNTIPDGEITSMTSNLNTLTVNVSANDTHSGVSGYGYLIQTDSTCPATGYVSSNNSSYTFNVSSSGVYYICIKIIDNVGNVNIISKSVLVEFEIKYENISSNYSCANSSAGTNPIFTYTGNCQIINDGNGDYRIKFLTSGEFTNNVSLNVDLFLVGGGGGGGSDCDSDPGFYCQAGGGGGGGYTKTYSNVSLSATSYAINIGSGGGVGGSGGTSYFGNSSTYFANGGGAGTSSAGGSGGSGGGSASCCRMNTSVNYYSTRGNGGSFGGNGSSCSADCPYQGGSSGGSGQGSTTCEFGLGTTSSCNSGVTVYSKGGTGSTWAENTGNGGNVSGSGSSGIVIMRNKR